MKNYFYISLLLLAFSLSSCSKRIYATPEAISQITNSGNFTFTAERANPTNMDVVNVLSSLPNGNSQNILNLDQGYVLTIKDKKLTVDLPYFGRLFTPSMDPSKNSFNFNTEDFTIKKSQNKKGNWQYQIVANNQTHTVTFNLEIFGNGKAYLSASSPDRQPISYDGYVKNPVTEKK
ncbi:protein of unknown function [Halpernia humi]|uniref:DUF4251 domain-containing protein n=1 Tax=Halpernia humi TaxID=493375 RepID=A0A1H5UMQ8_9FLAO|nr:DUF4251 domain-containing protein [Halpernia humi]SEF76290.1 protein of unknown function [Halpernia humi]